MSWRAVVQSLTRVPHEPEPPPGSPPRVFRAAANYFTLRVVQWAFGTLVFLFLPLFATAVSIAVQASQAPLFVIILTRLFAVLAWGILLLQVVFGWAVLRLDFELRWYMLSDRAIRIREGILTVREKTMALANVQNISIRQGPLQRLLGIADVEVKTAGGGSSAGGPDGKGKSLTEPMHVAYFRGVDNAEAIRDLIREGVRRQLDSGLGDPDDHRPHEPTPVSADASAAAAELLRETRKLRAVIEAAAGD